MPEIAINRKSKNTRYIPYGKPQHFRKIVFVYRKTSAREKLFTEIKKISKIQILLLELTIDLVDCIHINANIFKNKYLDQKKLVKDHFYYLVLIFQSLIKNK